jgi:hypothetical protein
MRGKVSGNVSKGKFGASLPEWELDMLHSVDLKGLAKSLYERRNTGIIVPYEARATTGWTPSEHECHINVDRFVLENSGHKAVRGWLVYNFELGPWLGWPAFWRFNAHSVIEDVNNRLFDITPAPRASKRYPFIRHDGPEGEFEALLASYSIRHLDHPIE